jgi:ATP-dependent exoDNAse (exonuclease V) alpha subunit
MAIYKLSVHMISRRAGQSAGERQRDHQISAVANVAYRMDVLHNEIVAPSGAPDWSRDRKRLWNAVEAAETRRDAQLCREATVAIPLELSREQAVALLRKFCRDVLVSQGMVADFSLHSAAKGGDEHNIYGSILLTTRVIEDGHFGPKAREWNRREVLLQWRAAWDRAVNQALEAAGREERVDHRSAVERGLGNDVGELHVGAAATAMERRGIETEGDELRRRMTGGGESGT